MTVNEFKKEVKKYVSEEMNFNKNYIEREFNGKRNGFSPMLIADMVGPDGKVKKIVMVFSDFPQDKKAEMLAEAGMKIATEFPEDMLLGVAWLSEGWMKRFDRGEEHILESIKDYEDKTEAIVISICTFTMIGDDLAIYPVSRDTEGNITLDKPIDGFKKGHGENYLIREFFAGFQRGMKERCSDMQANMKLMADHYEAWYKLRIKSLEQKIH